MQLAEQPPRPLSVAATVVALIFALAWPPVLGTVAGIALSFAFDDWTWLKTGAILGALAGVLFSAGTLAASYVINRVMPPPAPVVEAAPAQIVTTYAPLGSSQDVRIIPLASYDTLIDKVRQRDLVWFVVRITRHGHSLRKHLGLRAPSGQIVDATFWRSLCKPLRKAGVIVGAESRKSGTLRTKDTQAILAQLGIDGTDSSLFLFNGASLD